ncbi:concanavalin A-like lectin/glucanase domain-containing protein [Dichotomocladium elegans]|nr:concanavalin A-like lectin/glucanase domain-containing protein [Dichotomocladium elegans]
MRTATAMAPMSLLVAVVLQLSLLAATGAASEQEDSLGPIVCDCGFIDENGRVWSEVWHSDYSTYKASLQQDKNYIVMDYTVRAKYENTLDRVFSPANVQLNSDWGGVELVVRKQADNRFTSASFGTRRDDLLYGTFRSSLKTSAIPGTVAAFFFFRNNTCEIDMELLSQIQNPWRTYFSVQPQLYNPDGTASNITNDKHVLSFNPTTDFHEYRFDWVPDAITFYLDSEEANQFTQSIPNAPGRLLLNHWTDGNPHFSGIPKETAVLQVANMTAFFNSSDASRVPACKQTKSACRVADIMNKNLIPASASGSSSTTPTTAPSSSGAAARHDVRRQGGFILLLPEIGSALMVSIFFLYHAWL